MAYQADIAAGTTVTGDTSVNNAQPITVEGLSISAVISHTASRKGIITVSGSGVDSGTLLLGGQEYVSAGGTAYGTVAGVDTLGATQFAGAQTVWSGGVASGTILSGGSQVVSGGSAFNTSGTGNIAILAGGTATGINLSFGTATISGASESNGVYGGGTVNINSGGVTTGDTLIGNAVLGGVVFSEIENIANGGSATSTTVGNNARQIVSAGATATSTTVLSGGTIELVASGASADPGLHISDGGKIVLDYIDFTSATADFNYVTDVLTITGQTFGGGTATTTLQLSGDYTGEYFNAVEVPGGQHIGTQITETSTPCYCPGTLIATDKGEVPVETLAIGDRVATVSGEMRPIKWIGKRSFAGRFVMGRTDILPVCIKAGALADNVPARDLWISPHHAMYLDGVLIEAKDLVNGVTIMQASKAETVEYYHVELDSHDVLFAEGAPSETYVDDESRAMFHNAQEFAKLYPDEAFELARYYAPRIEDGEVLEAIRGRIGQRASLIEGHRAAA